MSGNNRQFLVPGATVSLHPNRNPHNPGGYRATSLTPHIVRPQPDPAPLSSAGTSSDGTNNNQQQPNWMEVLRKCEEQYRSVMAAVANGSTVNDALPLLGLTSTTFIRRKEIAEMWITDPDVVEKELNRPHSKSDLKSIYLTCRRIASTPRAKKMLAKKRLNSDLIPENM